MEIGKEIKSPQNTLVRAFVALDFDGNSIKILEALVTALRSSAVSHMIRWTPIHQFHVTLKYLGNIDEDLIQRAADKFKTWNCPSLSSPLSLASLTAFPTTQTANFIVATFNDPEGQLEKLARQIDTFFGTVGIAIRTRRLLPHVTLATTQVPFDARKWLAINALPSLMHELTFPTLTFYRSDLTSNGTMYTSIIRHCFITGTTSSNDSDTLDSKYRAGRWYLDRQKDLENTPETTNKIKADYERPRSHI